MLEILNEHLFYPYDKMMEGDFDLGDDDGYERWKRLGKSVPVYYKGKPKDTTQGITRLMGPYGDYLDDARTVAENIALPSNRIVTSSGTEYFVRPEDKDAMMAHYYLKMLLMGGNAFGFGSKELDKLVNEMDNLPMDRRLSSEEQLAAYEIVADKYGESFEGIFGEGRVQELLEDKNSVFDKQRIVASTRSSLKSIVAEQHMKQSYPEDYKLFINESRKLTKNLKNARDYYAYLRGKRESMKPETFERYKLFLDTYLGLVKPTFYVEEQYIESTEE